MLRTVAGDQLVLEADDHRIITYSAADKMKVEKDGAAVELTSFSAGDHITVDSTADENGFFTAVAVTFNSAGNAADRTAATRTWDLPDLRPKAKQSGSVTRDPGDDRPVLRRNGAAATEKEKAEAQTATPETATATEPERPATAIRPNDPAPESDDPGRPALRRGRPEPRASSSSVDLEPAPGPVVIASMPINHDGPQAAATTPPAELIIPVQEDAALRKARESMADYGASLPNFFAKQTITRYESEGKSGWRALDLISADVAYENGTERYTNLTVGGKATKKSMQEVGGTWSTGQFQGLIDEVFDPATAATFRKAGQETIRGRSATMFKFDVKRENARWRINAPSQLYFPAYRGTVWIDKETSRVLRLEMEARGIPLLFPFDKIESATDYDLIRLSTPQQFLLPVSAEVLSCETGTTRCSRNRIEYRNYRKFGAESGISFDENQ
ncbi:MAG: hypothetical protein ABL967_04450 [Bryobacteraceae bacterium]